MGGLRPGQVVGPWSWHARRVPTACATRQARIGSGLAHFLTRPLHERAPTLSWLTQAFARLQVDPAWRVTHPSSLCPPLGHELDEGWRKQWKQLQSLPPSPAAAERPAGQLGPAGPRPAGGRLRMGSDIPFPVASASSPRVVRRRE